MKLDKDSRGTLAMVYSLSILAILLIGIFVSNVWISLPVSLIIIWFCIWQTAFFRVPVRNSKGASDKVSAVADGRICIIQKAFEGEYLKKECLHVCIYMNFFDVHANFWPIDGEVTYYKYHPGAHALAFKPKASDENEHTCTCIRNSEGREVFFKQIAGGFARRIVNHAVIGNAVKAGDQCGIIKFGSRIDYFLPIECNLKVEVGQLVRACETIIAEI